MILALYLMDWVGVSIYILLALAVIFLVIGFIQTLHNYKKWKEEIGK